MNPEESYDLIHQSCKELMNMESFDLWNLMRLSSIIDRIIFKVTQVRKLESQQSEQIDNEQLNEMKNNLRIIHNCAIMAIMKINNHIINDLMGKEKEEALEEDKPITFYVNESDIPEIEESG